MLKDTFAECKNCDPWLLSCFFLFFLPNNCYERISPGICSTLRVKNMCTMETGRVLKLADSPALLKLLETFTGPRDEGVIFFRESGHKNVSNSSEQLSHGSRYKQKKKILKCRSPDPRMLYFALRTFTGNTFASTNNQELSQTEILGRKQQRHYILGGDKLLRL